MDHALERCPDCHYRLQGHSLDYTREVIELPEPQPLEVIEHRIIKRYNLDAAGARQSLTAVSDEDKSEKQVKPGKV